MSNVLQPFGPVDEGEHLPKVGRAIAWLNRRMG
jgi:hypothetical protein